MMQIYKVEQKNFLYKKIKKILNFYKKLQKGAIFMKKMIINSQNNYIEIESEDIKNIIESFNEIKEVRNISDGMEDKVMGFDVTLSSEYIQALLKNEIEEMVYSTEDEAEAALLEQAEYISDALVDNIKEFIENRYNISEYHGAYNIYRASLEEGIGLTLTLSFGEVKHGRLHKLASSVSNEKIEFR